MSKLTQEQISRTIQAIDETYVLLNRESAYLPHLQNKDRLAFYRSHIAKLQAMVAESRKAA